MCTAIIAVVMMIIIIFHTYPDASILTKIAIVILAIVAIIYDLASEYVRQRRVAGLQSNVGKLALMMAILPFGGAKAVKKEDKVDK